MIGFWGWVAIGGTLVWGLAAIMAVIMARP